MIAITPKYLSSNSGSSILGSPVVIRCQMAKGAAINPMNRTVGKSAIKPPSAMSLIISIILSPPKWEWIGTNYNIF